jgi:hypothetical protein
VLKVRYGLPGGMRRFAAKRRAAGSAGMIMLR